MRLLLYIVILTVGLTCSTPAFANKASLPNDIKLKLNQAAGSGQMLSVSTELGTLADFYRGSAKLFITPHGKGSSSTIELFEGSGSAGFGFVDEVKLPSLAPGRYRIHGIFSVLRNEQDKKPLRVGTNLYIDVRQDRVLSSQISFNDIERKELKARLAAREQNLQSNDPSVLKIQDPELYQALENANQVQMSQLTLSPTEEPKQLSASGMTRKAPGQERTVELVAREGKMDKPAARLKPRPSRLDRENAIPETPEDEY